MRLVKTTIILLILFQTLPALAYRKGFHQGPYIRLVGGVISSSFDNNARTGTKTANDQEGAFGAEFGWDLWDSAGPVLLMKYATKKVRNSREHIFSYNLNVKYIFVLNALTNISGSSFHILPFVQGGPAGILAAVPGDPDAASTDPLFVWGIGGGLGAGIDFQLKKYLYFGVVFQGDLLHFSTEYQVINGVREKIIAGGWKPVWSLLGMLGVHF